ncbi:MAG: ImmA/IrrE family metallo-endopeptidase [Oscillospiraceae bacterium]
MNKMTVGSIIYSKTAVENFGRLFVVKSLDTAGNMNLWALSSDISPVSDAVMVQPDKLNWLRKPTQMRVDAEVQMSATWDFVQQPGVIDSDTMAAAMDCVEQYKKEEKPVEIISAGEPVVVDPRDVRDKIKDLYDNFSQNPEIYLDYLHFSGQFYRYSARNQILIYMQNPYSTFVTSRTRWAKMGYDIKQAEYRKSMQIYKPVPQKYFDRNGALVSVKDATRAEKLKIAAMAIPLIDKQYFAQMPVWDISQTNCPVDDYPKIYDTGHSSVQHKELFEAVKQVAELEGIAVTVEDLRSIALSGYYNPADNTIHINSVENDTKSVGTLCHEYAHALLHNTSSENIPAEIQEFEAESLALVLLSSYDLPQDDIDVGYMAKYLDAAKEMSDFSMEKSVQRISKAMNHIETRLQMQINVGIEQPINAAQEIQRNFMTNIERT